MSHPPRRGFTLIELMTVVAIIAILALIALPSFQDRIIRNQIREALPLADIAKPPVQAAWAASQPLPADNAAAGLPAAEKIVNEMVQSVAVRDGAIDITFGPRANGALRGKTLSLRPAVVEDARIVPVTWLCGAATAPTPMVAKGEDRTTVPARFLPPRCRG